MIVANERRIDASEHAKVLRQVCGGNIRQASEICLDNLMLGDPRQANYWAAVWHALAEKEAI
jgi:hypothetical protein